MVVDVVKRPGEGKQYLVVTGMCPIFFLLFILNLTVCVGVTSQMASLVSTALSCPLSAGQPTVSVLLLLVLSAAARYTQLVGNGLIL